MHADPVTPAMREAAFTRDREIVADAVGEFGYAVRWTGDRLMALMPGRTQVVCPVITIDPGLFGSCWGRWQLDHVKDRARLGLRAKSDLAHLMSICDGHCEPGMRAGLVWNLGHRIEQREYLKHANKEA